MKRKLSLFLIPILILWGSLSYAAENSNDGIAGAGAQYSGAASNRQ
ncbi:hypothetical protein [Sporomusa acidovorans]|nr:hypothetical protein [Sporomusa acidovorans]